MLSLLERGPRPEQRDQTRRKPNLAAIMAYQFDPLLHRMVDKHGWTDEQARSCFEDLKRFFYLCAVSDAPIAPSEKIDEMWHNFILFTADYAAFCRTEIGYFIHHRPRRRDEQPSIRNLPLETLKLATATFGKLSDNWRYKRADGTTVSLEADCGDACESCSPSTNCQSGD